MKLPPILSRLLGRRAVRGPGDSLDVDATEAATEAATLAPASSAKKPHKQVGGFTLVRRLFNPALRKATPACLLARLENGVEVIYALHGDGTATRVQDVPTDCPLVLSATVDDLRLVLPEALPHAAAKSRLIRETASYEKLGVVSAGLAVYGTQFARIAEARAHGQRLAPLSALADRLALRQHAAVPSVTGFVFGEDAEGTMAIAVFFAQLADGKTKAYISVNPDNLHAIYGAFIAGIGLPEDTEPVVFTQAEALAGLTGFYAAYPSQDEVLGIPAHLVWRGALAASAVLCLAAGGWWWVATQALDTLKAEAALSRTRQAQHVEAIGLSIAGDLPAFNRLMGLSPQAGLSDAASLYLPGSRVESTLSAQESLHDVFVPLRLRTTDVADDPDSHAMKAAFALSRRDCQRTALDYSGALDEIRIRFRCPGGNAAAAPFRG
ncbi:MAG: hypothetical protein Q8Q28_18080 [Pseudomonadota bacterium]|nr:hypothetical protein [Pseudomonadota bacterium]